MARRALGALVLVALAYAGAALPRASAAVVDIDPTFGVGGQVRIDHGGPSVDVARAISGAFVAGSAGDHMAVSSAVHPATTGFGDAGRVTSDFGQPSAAYALLEGEHLVAAGSAGDDVALAVFVKRDGSPLRWFGTEGQVTLPFGNPAAARAVVDQGGGYLMAGEAASGDGGSLILARLTRTGVLDTTFGAGGRIVADLTPGPDAGLAAATLPSGTFLVAGRAGGAALLARFLPDGSPDTTFGIGGRVLADVTAGPDDYRAVRVLQDGRILVAGVAGSHGHVARYRPDGLPDTTFGTGGAAPVAVDGRTTELGGLTTLVDETVVVAGVTTGPGGSDAVVALLDTAGTPVAGFGTGGQVLADLGGPADQVGGIARVLANPTEGSGGLPVPQIRLAGGDGGDMVVAGFDVEGQPMKLSSAYPPMLAIDFGRPHHEQATEIAALPDGRMIVAGSSGTELMLVRLMPDGSPDPTFRPGRSVVRELGRVQLHDLAPTPDGGLVVMLSNRYSSGLVARFGPTGELDTAFGEAGLAVSGAGGLAVQPDGRIVTLGGHRLLSDGTPDGTELEWPPGLGPAVEVAVRADGRIVAAYLPSLWIPGVHVLGLTPDGAVDTAFGGGGRTGDLFQPAVALLPDGRLVLAGRTTSTGPSDVLVSVLDATGDSDHRFGPERDGTRTFGFEVHEHPQAVVGGPDGSFYVVVHAFDDIDDQYTEIVKILPDGRLDGAFGRGGLMRVHDVLSRPWDAAMTTTGPVVAGAVYGPDIDAGLFRVNPDRPSVRPLRVAGWNGAGQLGDGTTTDRPAAGLAGLDGVVQVSAGAYHSLALRSDGTVWAWGWNAAAQLGDGTTIDRHRPVRVPGLTGVVEVAAGGYHNLARRSDGTVWAWGWNAFGEVGDGTTTVRTTPVPVPGLSGARGVSAGAFHSMALLEGGRVATWGWNGVGQLGTGTTVDQHRPFLVGTYDAVQVAAGSYHSLALQARGGVLAWGWNAYGQLGHDFALDTVRPMGVRVITDAVAISGGGLHSVAVRADGTVWSWGSGGAGQMGNGTRVDSRVPVPATGPRDVVEVAAGAFHTIALGRDGSVSAWGWNPMGQLGLGTTGDRLAPEVVPGMAGAVDISGGGLHSLFL